MRNIISDRKKQLEEAVKHFQKKEKESGLVLSFPDEPATAKQNMLQILYEVFAGVLLFVGVFFSIQSLLDIPCDYWIFPVIAAGVLLFCSVFRKNRYLLHISLLIVTVFVVAILVTGSENVAKGLTITANQIMETLGRNRNLVFTQYEIELAGQEASYYANYFLAMFALLLAFLCAAVVRTGNKLFAAVLIAPIFVMQFGFRGESDLFFAILSVLAVFLIWSGGWMGESVIGMKGTKAEEMRLLVSVMVSAVFVVLFLAAYFIFPAENYVKSDFMTNMRDRILHQIDESRYYTTRTDSFTQGDFRYLENLELKEEPALEVTMDVPQSVYLRGYVGSVYTSNKWESLDTEKVYEDHDVFYWLWKSGYSGLNQLSLMENYGIEEEERPELVSFSVRNVGANSKYIYTPYELNTLPSELAESENNHDETILSTEWKGSRFYQYTSSQNILIRYPEIAAALDQVHIQDPELTKDFDNNELHYRKNVYENYLEIPEETEALLEEIVGVSIEDGKKHVDYDQAIAYIKNYLKTEMTYSTELKHTGTSKDFLERFLTEEKTGYSVHYATAATMLFRYCGIPSRYVEGYLITPDAVKGKNESQTITVDGTWAHAWTEIYEDGIGWIPVEVTPPYDGIMKQAELPQTSLKHEQNPNNADGASEEEIAPTDMAIRMDNWDIQTILFWIGMALLIALLLFLIGFIIWRVVKRSKTIQNRTLEFDNPDRARAVRNMYRYILLILKCQGIKKEEISHQGYREGIRAQWSEEREEEFVRVLYLAQKAFFSLHKLTDEEWKEVKEYQSILLEEMLEDKKWYQKLRYKYWNYLY